MKAYELIDKPEKWCQEHYAVDEDGDGTLLSHGVAFCALGAIYKAYDLEEGVDSIVSLPEGSKLILYLTNLLGHGSIAVWNDGSDWETVYGTLKELDI